MIAEKLLYCNVCKKDIAVGESYEVAVNNKFSCRHATCIPKSKPRKPKKEERPPSNSTKRRKAGGHGYTGGDGWVSLTNG